MNLKIPLIIGILSLFLGVSAEICSSFTNNNGATNCCTNGGYLDSKNQTCICPSGYLGVHCEAVKTSMPPDNHFKAGGTSFNIMNVNLYTQYWGAQTYKNIQQSVNAHFTAFPKGYDMYNLLETSGSPTLDSLDIPIYSYTFDKWYSDKTTFTLTPEATDTGLYWCYEVPIFQNLITMIQKYNLKNTVITILTQHPPSDDKRYEAREIAVAFGIRINVLWTKDLTFNRCTDDQVQGFKTFVDVTGGLFVELQSELNDQTTIELVSQVLLTHYKPQYVAIQSFPNCTTPQTLPLVIDPTVNGPYNFVFLGGENTYREATYINYDENTPSSVINDNVPTILENYGAALRFKLDSPSPCPTPSSASLIITDCNGVVSAKYDSKQVSSFIDSLSSFQFIPFFCSSQPSTTCISGAESKYDAQLVSDSFSITQSFQCRPGTGPSDNCKLQDANGNNQCSGVSPFHRGPSGTVFDCSNHGTLVYNNDTQKFRCACDDVDVFSGPSCEVVSCSTPNLDTLATDNAYHTYTVVIGLESGTGFLTIDDAQVLFGLKGLGFADLKEVWKYQLLTICADGIYDMLYSGSDLKAFQDMLVKYADTYRACQVPAADGVHDLTSIYQRAVQGIGRNVKGIIVYYTEASSMINVTLNDFITASQPYQQQLFVYAINEGNSPGKLLGNDSIVQAAMSTGGFLIHSFITDELTTFIDKSFIPSLLQSSSSIAWLSSSQYGNFPIVADKPSTINYLIAWGAGLELDNLNRNANDDFYKCIYAANSSYFCKLQGDHTVLGGVASGNPFYVAVYLLDDVLAPKAQIISGLSQDSSDAVSTSTSDARTMLTFNIREGYSVVANDGDGGITRNAGRNGCTFTNTAYSVFATQKYAPGANIAKVTIKNPDGTKTFTRFFPFGTTSAPVCQNGGTPITSSGSCACPQGFQGPDCSLVNCSESSISNAWYDVCVCKSIEDATCAARYTSFF
ncbi:unnamed protein product [Caenorhabditis brenneri]